MMIALLLVASEGVGGGGSNLGGGGGGSQGCCDASDGSESSTRDSSDSSKTGTGKTITTAAAIVIVAGGIASAIGFGVSSTARREAKARGHLSKFLKRHHSAVVHETLLAGGPMLESWTAEWGFGESERQSFFRALRGSSEQRAMIVAMGNLEEPRAVEEFASALVRVRERAASR